jgi:hypothetical protein
MSQPPHGVPPGQPWSPQQGQPYQQQPQFAAFPPPQPPRDKPVYQRPWFAFLALFLVVGTIGAALDRDDDATPAAAATSSSASSGSQTPAPIAPTSTVPPAPVAPTAAPPTTVPPTAAPPTTQAAPVVVDFVMPSVVGMTLQDAQDLIQTNGVFLSLSHDLLGTRNQVLDANWRVCTQNVPAGQRVTGDAEGVIDLGAVKLEEPCP